ncbi:Hypothetical predicted protein [Paramuricea clavata]|uniref:Uncharacterized protein n=1 Tax=Paramuricea clavata TaxID=317549 RepID=A0A6S7G8B6_PARCT|nr:Hypothetical predicted protein [Paramuricea clavata]
MSGQGTYNNLSVNVSKIIYGYRLIFGCDNIGRKIVNGTGSEAYRWGVDIRKEEARRYREVEDWGRGIAEWKGFYFVQKEKHLWKEREERRRSEQIRKGQKWCTISSERSEHVWGGIPPWGPQKSEVKVVGDDGSVCYISNPDFIPGFRD